MYYSSLSNALTGAKSRKRGSDLAGLMSPGTVDVLKAKDEWKVTVSGVPSDMGHLPVYIEGDAAWVPVAWEWEVNPAGNSDIEWRSGLAYRPMFQVVGAGAQKAAKSYLESVAARSNSFDTYVVAYYSFVSDGYSSEYVPSYRIVDTRELWRLASITTVWVLIPIYDPYGRVLYRDWVEPAWNLRANEELIPGFNIGNIARDAIKAAQQDYVARKGGAVVVESGMAKLPRPPADDLPRLPESMIDIADDDIAFNRATDRAAQWRAEQEKDAIKLAVLGYFIEPKNKEQPIWKTTAVAPGKVLETINTIHKNNRSARQFYTLDENGLTFTPYTTLPA